MISAENPARGPRANSHGWWNKMKITKTRIPEVVVLEPQVFGDERGFFLESYNQKSFEEIGLVRVVSGSIWDVAVDIRRSSPTFGEWVGEELSEGNKRMLWIPEGFAHGFLVSSERADVLYKVTDFRAPSGERRLLWNDPQLAIDWPLRDDPLLSQKDRDGLLLSQAEVFE
jgi:dTDP-4-dehydrorhamnose 3,5-epimerase